MIYQFENFRLDTALRELRQNGALIALEPQVFDLLRFLISARDRVVSRDDMLEEVWNGRIVSEATLSSRLNAARVALGDTGSAQRLIRTLPRKGVRFVGTVEEVAAPTPGPIWREGPKLPSIAVLPFTNMSGAPDQEYFADGMAEEIITALSRSSGLFVIARNSSFTYKGKSIDIRQVGQELNVLYVLEGSVRRDSQRIRISGQLVDAATGAHLWADRFDGGPEDIFALQERVAASVVAAIEPTLQAAEITRLQRNPPAQPGAYDHLLRAYAHLADFTAAGMGEARAHLSQALALDPAYAQAMAAHAYCTAQCHFQGWTQQDDTTRAEAVSLAWRATEHAPNDAQVLWMAAFAIWNMDRARRDRARGLFSRSLLINPNSAMALTLAGWIELMCGNTEEGGAMVARAQRLNPRDPRGWLMEGVLSIAAIIAENYAGALTHAEQALAQNRRFAVALRTAAVAQVKLGQVDQAKSTIQELLAIEPSLTISNFLARIPMPLPAMEKTYREALATAGLPA